MKRTMQDKFSKLARREKKTPPLPCPGDCESCPSSARCRTFAASRLAEAQWFGDRPGEPRELSLEELGKALALAAPFADWLAQVQDYALRELLAGRRIPGWKVVEGRSNRRFTDCAAAFQALTEYGVPENALYEKKPLSLSQVERLVGRHAFGRIAGRFVEKPLGKPVLAPENDPGKPYPAVERRER